MSKETGDTEKKPSFQFYPADLLSDPLVMCMDNAFIGGFVKLLCYDWLDNGLVNCDDDLWRLGNFPPRYRYKKKWIERLRLKFIEHPTKKGFITNPRLQYERQKQADFSKQRSEAGAKGAASRWQSHDLANGKPHNKPLTKNGSSSSSSSSSSKSQNTKEDAPEKKLDFTLEDLNLATVFRKDILDFKPDYIFEKSEEDFAHDINFIRRSKKKDISQIVELWTWARQSEFWSTVILAPSSLNKNWGQLEIQRDRKPEEGDIDSWMKDQKEKEKKGWSA